MPYEIFLSFSFYSKAPDDIENYRVSFSARNATPRFFMPCHIAAQSNHHRRQPCRLLFFMPMRQQCVCLSLPIFMPLLAAKAACCSLHFMPPDAMLPSLSPNAEESFLRSALLCATVHVLTPFVFPNAFSVHMSLFYQPYFCLTT